MNLIKRAWLYIYRQKVRSLILLLILIIVSTFVMTGIAIQNGSTDTAKRLRSSVGGVINLGTDMNQANSEYVPGDGQNGGYQYVGDHVTQDTVDAIKKIKGVTDINAESKGGFLAAAANFKYLPTQLSESNMDFGGMETSEYGYDSSMSVVMSSEKFSGFTNGNIKLEKGRHINKDDKNVILISEELAKYNKLSVGDKIKVYCWEKAKMIELEIIGLFSGTEGENNDALLPMDRAGNQGIVDFTTKRDGFGAEFASYDNINIFVEDPADIEKIRDEIAELPEVKGKTFKLGINRDDYDDVAGPLESLQSLVFTLMIVILIISIVILTLLLIIWIRGRKKEIGILLSLGKGKANIILQLMAEVILIAVLAFGLSYFTSNLIAENTGDFLASQVEQSMEKDKQNSDAADPGGMITEEDLDQLSKNSNKSKEIPELDIDVKPDYLLWVYIIGILIIIVSVVIASYSVIRYQPKDILSRMS